MKRSFVLNIILLFFATTALAQTQQGYVKTKGRLGSNGAVIHGTPLSGATVTVKGSNAVLSANNGKFSLVIPSNSYYLQSVQKQGYVLTDPDVLSKQYVQSKNPLTIVMEDKAQQAADRRAIERKISSNLYAQLQQRSDELEALREQQKITEEKYRELLQKLDQDQDDNEKIIKDMAERYSRMDFDEVDEFNRHISSCIINGRLTEADSLLRKKGDINTRIRQLEAHHDANVQTRTELERSESMEQKNREDIAKDCYTKFEIFKMQHKIDSAAYYIELRASLAEQNSAYSGWLYDAGLFLKEYMANYPAALSYYLHMLQLIENDALPQYQILKKGYDGIASVYLAQDSLTLALKYYEQLKKYVPNTDSHDMAVVIGDIGIIYNHMGQLEKALEYKKQALSIELSQSKVNPSELATAYNNLANVYVDYSKLDEALDNFRKALQIWLDEEGDESLSVALAYNNIGSALSKKGQYKESLDYIQKALDIRSRILGDTHPHVADCYNELGVLCYNQGDFEQAEVYYGKALNIFQTVFGQYHSSIALMYNNIAQLFAYKKPTKALEYEQKALDIYLRLYGDNHSEVARIYGNIGTINFYQTKYDDALEYQKKALAIREKYYPDNQINLASSYRTIGVILKNQGKLEEAITYQLLALETEQKLYGEQHKLVAIDYHNLSATYQKLKDFKKSIDCMQKALAINISLFGNQHMDVARNYNGLGTIYSDMEDYEKAIENFKKALEIWKVVHGEKHPDIAVAYQNIGYVYYCAKNYSEAMSLYDKAIPLFIEAYGEQHAYVASTYVNKGLCYLDQQIYDKALPLFEKALEIRIATLGENHSLTQKTKDRIAETKEKMNKK